MKFPQSLLSVLCCVLSIGLASTNASAEEKENSSSNIEYVLNKVNQQHNNASSLVKISREHQPISLAQSSGLLAVSEPIQRTTGDHLLDNLTAVAANSVSKFKQSGLASWYGENSHGEKTASGEIFNMNAMTAAHHTLQLGSYVRVTNKDNGRSVIVKINDRSDSATSGSSVLDLSYGAAKRLGMINQGLGKVIIEKVSGPELVY